MIAPDSEMFTLLLQCDHQLMSPNCIRELHPSNAATKKKMMDSEFIIDYSL